MTSTATSTSQPERKHGFGLDGVAKEGLSNRFGLEGSAWGAQPGRQGGLGLDGVSCEGQGKLAGFWLEGCTWAAQPSWLGGFGEGVPREGPCRMDDCGLESAAQGGANIGLHAAGLADFGQGQGKVGGLGREVNACEIDGIGLCSAEHGLGSI
jgi:hypothetical protein